MKLEFGDMGGFDASDCCRICHGQQLWVSEAVRMEWSGTLGELR